MKELVLNPINLSVLACVVLVYSLLIFGLIAKKKFIQKLEAPMIILLFIGILPVAFIPFTLAHPHRLALGNLSTTGALTTLIIYTIILFFLKRVCFPDFPKAAVLIVQDPLLLALPLMVVASALWSQTPEITLRSSVPMIGLAILAAQVAQKYSWQEIERFLRWTLTIIGILSIPIAVLLPSIRPFGDPWGGFLDSSKVLGSLMTLNAVLWLMDFLHKPKNKKLSGLITVCSILVLMITGAKSALVGFFAVVYVACTLRVLQASKYKQSVVIIIVAAIISIFLSILVSASVDFIFQSLGKDPTLTGRTIFWAQLTDAILNHPIGYGYNGFWQPWRDAEDPSAFIGAGSLQLGDYRPPHSHNGFMEIALQIGLPGLFLFLASFLVTVLRAIWQMQFHKGTQALFPLVLLVYLVMSNLGETEVLGLIGTNHTWFLYALVAIKVRGV